MPGRFGIWRAAFATRMGKPFGLGAVEFYPIARPNW